MKQAINEQLTDTSSWVDITLPSGSPCGAFYIKALDPSSGSFDIRSSSVAETFFTVSLDMAGLCVPGKKKGGEIICQVRGRVVPVDVQCQPV